jgi:hypothetical protein
MNKMVLTQWVSLVQVVAWYYLALKGYENSIEISGRGIHLLQMDFL